MKEGPLVVLLWLDNLGVFYPLVSELGLANIAAAFAGGTAVRHLIGAVPSVTESAEVVIKAGCGLDRLQVLGEVTFDRDTRQYLSLKQTDFDRETRSLTPIEGAPRLGNFVKPALAKRLIPNLGFTWCQIGCKLGQVGAGRVISLESEEAMRLEQTASLDIIPVRIQALLQAVQNYQADLYLLNISGDSVVHDQGATGQTAFLKKLDHEFPTLVDGLAARGNGFTLIMFSDHGSRPIQGHIEPQEFLAGIRGLVFAGKNRNAAVVSNGRGSLYLYLSSPDDRSGWHATTYRQLRDYHGQDILAAIADVPETVFVVCNREEGGIAILSADGEATLSAVDGGFAYRLVAGKDPLGLDGLEGRAVSAQEMLERTHDKPFPYPLQWLELMQAPCCGDVMIVVDKYAFFWDKPWVVCTHGGPSCDEVGTSLMAVGPEKRKAGIIYGRQLACGSIGHLYGSLCRVLSGQPPDPRWSQADLLFGTVSEGG